jgi:hypothetical protein
VSLHEAVRKVHPPVARRECDHRRVLLPPLGIIASARQSTDRRDVKHRCAIVEEPADRAQAIRDISDGAVAKDHQFEGSKLVGVLDAKLASRGPEVKRHVHDQPPAMFTNRADATSTLYQVT